MKVAHLLRKYDPSEWGGTETAIRELLRGLRAHDVRSIVYAPRLPAEAAQEKDVLLSDGVDVRRFGAFVPVIGLSPAEKKQLVAVGGNLMSMSLVAHLLREPGLAVMHTHVLGRLGGVARFVARRRALPLVVTIHGGFLDLPVATRDMLAASRAHGFEYGRVFGALLKARRVIDDADAVVTVNPREAELLRERYPRLRVERIPHGIPSERYVNDSRAAADAYMPELRGKRVLLCVGRIDAVKNQAFLVDAMPRIRERFPDVVLVLVGPTTDPAHEREVRSKVASLGLEDAVIMRGQLSPDDPRLIGLYQRADAFVLASVSETFGLVLLEAWAAGAPVVASDTSGARQVVKHGENGYLFGHGAVADYVASVAALLADRAHAEALAREGRKLSAAHDTVAIAAIVRALYDDLVRKR